jgi:tetratricopeptide (TPR) repeat protein
MGFFRKDSDEGEWETMNLEVIGQTRNRRYGEALHLALELADYTRRNFGRRSPQMVTALNNVGLIYVFLEKYEEAESHLLAALQLCEEVHGKHNEEAAAVNRNLALLYQAKTRKIEGMI